MISLEYSGLEIRNLIVVAKIGCHSIHILLHGLFLEYVRVCVCAVTSQHFSCLHLLFLTIAIISISQGKAYQSDLNI